MKITEKKTSYRRIGEGLFFVMLFVNSCLFGQGEFKTSKLDSLKSQLIKVEAKEKGELLNDIVREILIAKKDSALYYIVKSKKFNLNNEYYSSYLRSLKYECNYYNSTSEYKKIIETATLGVSFSKSFSSSKYIATFYNFMPYAYSILGNYTKEVESSRQAIFYAEKANDTLQMIIGHGYLSSFYWHIDDLESAIKETETAIELGGKYPGFDKTSTLLTNLATYYYANEMYKEALAENLNAFFYAKNASDSSIITQNIGIIYYLQDSLIKADSFFKKSYGYYSKTKLNVKKANHFYYRGMIALKTNKYLFASELIDSANYYANLSSSFELLTNTYYTQYQIALHFDNPNNAIGFLQQHYTYKDSIFAKKNITELKVNEWKLKLEVKEKERIHLIKQKKTLKDKIIAEKKARRLSTIAFIVSLAVIVLSIIVISQKIKVAKTKKLLRFIVHKNEIELKNKELISLKLQRINRNNNIEKVNTSLSDLKFSLEQNKVQSENLVHSISSISNSLKYNAEKDWEEFKIYFETLHENFYKKLKEKHSKITLNDEKLIAYLKVNMDTKQIARILHVTPQTVRTQKYRLRKKMDLPKNSNIRDYLNF